LKTLILTLFSTVIIGFSLQAQDLNTMDDSYYYHLKGTHQVNLSLGILNTTNFAFDVFAGTGAGDPTPSANLEYMYGLSNSFGIGVHFNYYRVDAQQVLILSQLVDNFFDDPDCAASCAAELIDPDSLLGDLLGGLFGNNDNCNCTAGSKERVNVFTFAVKGAAHIKRFKNIDTYSSFIAGYSINRRQTITEQILTTALNEANRTLDETPIPTFIYAASIGARYYLSPKIAIYGEYGLGNVHTLRLGATYRFMNDTNDIDNGGKKRRRQDKV